MKPVRVIDTGIRPCREQMAFDQAMIELHGAGEIPDTLRFLQFPPSVLVGRHQAISHELHMDACRAAGVGIGRRVTGGGALYLDEGQFGWELVVHKSTLGLTNLGDVARALCEAAATGLSKLGIDARYRPRNDIEVAGRKISGTGGFFDGDTIFYQGTVLVDMDGAKMASLLNVPAAKLAKHGETSAAQRIVTLRELFGGTPPELAAVKAALMQGFAETLGLDLQPGTITAAEEAAARVIYDDEIGTDEFVFGIDDPTSAPGILTGQHRGSGGTITAYVKPEKGNRIADLVLTGDFFVTPPRTIIDLEAHLRGSDIAGLEDNIAAFFQSAEVGLLTATAGDFSAAIRQALAPQG
jgi:lipoate---protein ligase